MAPQDITPAPQDPRQCDQAAAPQCDDMSPAALDARMGGVASVLLSSLALPLLLATSGLFPGAQASSLSKFCFSNTNLCDTATVFPRCTAALGPCGDPGNCDIQLGHEAESSRGPFPASHIPRQALHRVWMEGGLGASGVEARLSVGPCRFLPAVSLGSRKGSVVMSLEENCAARGPHPFWKHPQPIGRRPMEGLVYRQAVNQKFTCGWRM